MKPFEQGQSVGESRVQPFEGLVSLPLPHFGEQLGPPQRGAHERRLDLPGDRRSLLAIVANRRLQLAERYAVQSGHVALGATVAFERLAVAGRGFYAFTAGAALVRRGVPETVPPRALRMRLSRPAGVEVFDRQAQALRLGPPRGIGVENAGGHASNILPSSL